MNTKQDYIAVFDSGVGGISVLRHLRRVMPGERYLYFGDSANAPYGTKTKDEVEALTFAAARHLMARGVKALVVACNTATSAAIHDLREAYPDTIVIGIEPALKLAYDRYHGGGIGVMATPMTLREEKFEALMHRYDQSCRVYKSLRRGWWSWWSGGRRIPRKPNPFCGSCSPPIRESWTRWCWAAPTTPSRLRPFPGCWEAASPC